ncbi:Fanconi anemia group J protein homolog [Eumeta japonica]|uniref:DNA 5'-3' helicase n=1 Tax=Eumeta variegata TaxID=151549 RepID=A0A4C1SER8_EUMVA|nr:Fanconi anemia group J protein homolog [Eumeta japonica]
MPGEMARDAGLTLPEELQIAMLECLDRLECLDEELEHRYKAMDGILITFGVVQPKTLLTSTEEKLRDIVPNLTKIYDELCTEDIILEILRLRRHLEAASISLQEAVQWTTLQLLKFIVKWDYSDSVPNFGKSAEKFCKKLREDASSLYGVSQATGTLVESITFILRYLFNNNCEHMEDFRPVLVRNVHEARDTLPSTRGWRSTYSQIETKEMLSLRLLCMSPAVVFSDLSVARCVILSSGTLAPIISLYSELGANFPLKVSPNHVVPPDRVWVGTLNTCPDGTPLECTMRGTDRPSILDALGRAVHEVAAVTPNGVLCFLPSYVLMNKLIKRWRETGLWHELGDIKHLFQESRNAQDHNDVMEDYYNYVSTKKGAILFAVYRGKVSEGMDFKDHQARAVITVGIPYPNTFDTTIREKMRYNDKHTRDRSLLPSSEWLRVQAYRALNQAVGRCVRHRDDWGAVLLCDSRFTSNYYTEHLAHWLRNFLGDNHNSFSSLLNSPKSLSSFMQKMTIKEEIDL